ncbi:hypothetical protein LUZ60_004925 [Juncus effusus]|nr:hypothetical protein LUZ60_004925 [Juncus effusus]
MGSALGCFRGENSDEELRSSNCSFCLQWSIGPFINMYDTVFQRNQTRIAPLRITVPAPNPNSSDAELDTYISPPRPLAYDDPRCSHGQLALSRAASKAASPAGGNQDFGGDFAEGKKGESWYRTEFEEKNFGDCDDDYSSEDEENDCPICLEEYTEENPKMELQCNHDFHLSCIYEWMERSEACPVCGKVMLFDEIA